MRNCTGCGEPIHPKRLEIMPNTTRCVACSTVQKKGAVTVMKGTGDHTWIETIHLEHEDFVKYMEAEKKIKHISELDTSVESDLPFGFSETKLEPDA